MGQATRKKISSVKDITKTFLSLRKCTRVDLNSATT